MEHSLQTSHKHKQEKPNYDYHIKTRRLIHGKSQRNNAVMLDHPITRDNQSEDKEYHKSVREQIREPIETADDRDLTQQKSRTPLKY